MIRPVYAQACSSTGRVSDRLREALEWWLRVLELDITEYSPLGERCERAACKLFVDAASTPPHCAAVLCIDGKVIYTDAAPSGAMIAQLVERRDKQITSLECYIASICIAPLCAFVGLGNPWDLLGVDYLHS